MKNNFLSLILIVPKPTVRQFIQERKAQLTEMRNKKQSEVNKILAKKIK